MIEHDNPERVDPPEEPKDAICCETCGEPLTIPWVDCNGWYMCGRCFEDALKDTKHAAKWFAIWLENELADKMESTLPERGDRWD